MMVSKNTSAKPPRPPKSTILPSLNTGLHWHHIYIKKHLETFPILHLRLSCGGCSPLESWFPKLAPQQHSRSTNSRDRGGGKHGIQIKAKMRQPAWPTVLPDRVRTQGKRSRQISGQSAFLILCVILRHHTRSVPLAIHDPNVMVPINCFFFQKTTVKENYEQY